MTSLPLPTATPADPVIGLDLARHRALCVADVDGDRRRIPLTDGRPGLMLRWVDPSGRRHRIGDWVLDNAGVHQRHAVEATAAVAACVFPEATPTAPFVSIPTAFGPSCRAAMLDGFAAGGTPIPATHLIERPIAAFAALLDHRHRLGRPDPTGPFVLVDNDGGQLSMLAVDTDAQRLLFTMPLSLGPDEPTDLVVERLRTAVRELDRLRSHHELVRSDDWSSISSTVNEISVSGSMSDHPSFLEVITRLLPASAVVRDPVLTDPSEVVAFGLISLGVLDDWSAGWPTLSIAIDGEIVRPAGSVALVGDVDLTVERGAVLSLVDPDGRAVPVGIGSMVADGLALPTDLAGSVTLRTLSDGRVLVLGAAGVRPLTFSVAWPVTGSRAVVSVGALGRRPLELVNPRGDRSRQTTAA